MDCIHWRMLFQVQSFDYDAFCLLLIFFHLCCDMNTPLTGLQVVGQSVDVMSQAKDPAALPWWVGSCE